MSRSRPVPGLEPQQGRREPARGRRDRSAQPSDDRQEQLLDRYEALFEQAPDGIFIADLEGRYVAVNRAGCRMLGYEHEELIGKSITDLLPREDFERLKQARQELLAGKSQVAQWSLRRKDGSRMTAEVNAKILGDGRWLGFVRDISQRKRAEEALALSEERLRVALQDSPGVLFNQDRELRYTWIYNPHGELTRDKVIGRTDDELMPGPYADKLVELKRSVVEEGTAVRQPVAVELGGQVRHYDLRLEPLRDDRGAVIGLTGASWEITERKRIEDELQLLVDAGQTMMAAAADYDETLTALARLSVSYGLADWSLVDVLEGKVVRRLEVAHARPEQGELAHALEHVELERKEPHLLGHVLHTGEPILISDVTPDYLDSVAQNPAHLRLLQHLELRSFIAVPLAARGRLLGALAWLSSARARRYKVQDLRLAKALARLAALALDNARLYETTRRALGARDELLGVVAHDLRSPLNTIVLSAEVLRHRCRSLEERDLRALDTIARVSARMNRMVQEMLDVTRFASGPLALDKAPLDIATLLAEAVEAAQPAAEARALQIQVDVPRELPRVHADHDRVLQVLDNLISNAIKFTAPNGQLTIDAQLRDGEVVVRVSDTGCGIDPEQLPHIFDRLWQGRQARDEGGAGLGLAIAKAIVEAHDGRIWAESELDAGTTISFTLPVAKTSEQPPDATPA